jgi:hypothetical protein
MFGFDGCCCQKCGCFDDPLQELIVTLRMYTGDPSDLSAACWAAMDGQSFALTNVNSDPMQLGSCVWAYIFDPPILCPTPFDGIRTAMVLDARIFYNVSGVTKIDIQIWFSSGQNMHQWIEFETPHDCVFAEIAMNESSGIVLPEWWTISTP